MICWRVAALATVAVERLVALPRPGVLELVDKEAQEGLLAQVVIPQQLERIIKLAVVPMAQAAGDITTKIILIT